ASKNSRVGAPPALETCRYLRLRDVRHNRGAAMATTTWQAATPVQCVSTAPWLPYPGCDEPGGRHALTLGKIYEMLGVEGKGSFYRILDDSGEDFLYPVSHFRAV